MLLKQPSTKGHDARESVGHSNELAGRVHELRQLDNLVYTFYAVVHRDLKDRIVFLDCFSCFRSFIGRIRGFRLPIHLEAKSAAVSHRRRDRVLRHVCQGYGLGALLCRRHTISASDCRTIAIYEYTP
jgi:hypothetical protein